MHFIYKRFEFAFIHFPDSKITRNGFDSLEISPSSHNNNNTITNNHSLQ